ncbi:MAG: arginine--tRNA ligase [Patescibacteria group bacterium]
MVSRFIKESVKKALGELFPELNTVNFAVSPERRFGDYTTNAGMVAATSLGKPPKETAQNIVDYLSKDENTARFFSKIEVAGPGFVNFTLSDECVAKKLEELPAILSGGLDNLTGEKINVEFISANPTGALHIGHGRGAFYGDVLSNIFSFAGAAVTREYYINDSRESKQIKELGKTAKGEGNFYENTIDNIRTYTEINLSDAIEDIGFKIAWQVQSINKGFIEKDLNIKIDNWYSEDKKLRSSLLNDRNLAAFKMKELTYEKDGAVWLKTSVYGDDEDRVVVRSDGSKSYFLSDISYHADKFSRGYDRVIDIWGADHHGHVKRIEAVKKMLGWKGELKIFITQLVSLKENGASSKMSKRVGNVIFLVNLINEINAINKFGVDAVRWFFSEKSLGTHMEFDMALARERSAKNPVFYVQYAHARINSILEKAKNVSADESKIADAMKDKEARALAVKITEFPEVISGITEDYQVHKLTTYAYELASTFARFYEEVRVVGEKDYNSGALELATLAKETIAKSLNLLGISAPNKM